MKERSGLKMNGKKLKILTIFGTRPEIIKLFPVLERLRHCSDFQSSIVSTSQHREMAVDLLHLFGIHPDYDLGILKENQTLTDISSRVLVGLESLLVKERPDLVLVQGDTTTSFIGALSAFYQSIPVAHVEAGLRSFNKMHPYPEEMNRKMTSVLGDLHFAPTGESARNLVREGIDAERIFITGNTVVDSLMYVLSKNENSIYRYFPEDFFASYRVILVTAHRRENWGEPLEGLCEGILDLIEAHPDVQVIYPVHLNPNVRKTVFRMLRNRERIHLLDPLSYGSFVEAMGKAYLIITDSGGIQEEGPSLKKPILVFRKVTERPDGIHAGGVKLIGRKRENVFREASRLLDDPVAYKNMVTHENPYGDGKASERIVEAIRFHFGMAARPEDFCGMKP